VISRAVSLFLLVFALPTLAAAQSDERTQIIVVTGRGLDPGLGENVFDVARIDRTRLDHSASNRPEDVLRDVPGFQQFRRSIPVRPTRPARAPPCARSAAMRRAGRC
jgi:hypothetical protein